MMQSLLLFAALTAALTYVAALLYRLLWPGGATIKATPTGFGGLLPVALLTGCGVFGARMDVIGAFACLALATAAYWIDDAKELSARTRLAISFVTGGLLCGILLSGSGATSWPLVFGLTLAAAILNLVLTNMVNFYDGADLNLATFMALTAVAMLIFDPPALLTTVIAVTVLAFILPFAVMNSRPQTIYLGDAGAFAFAGLLTILAVIGASGGDIAPEVAIPLALPALDTFYVLVVRIVEKHDLLTRNYLHLYQQLNRHYKGFGYLLPQIANAVLVLSSAIGLQAAGLSRSVSVLLAMAVVTVPFYLLCRKLLLPVAKVCRPAP